MVTELSNKGRCSGNCQKTDMWRWVRLRSGGRQPRIRGVRAPRLSESAAANNIAQSAAENRNQRTYERSARVG
ncbi:hypothetical protein CE91St30_14840 [Raoultibacter timonensis]|uniref:Uncharacterized protein n=1 Tax=Raoultibacter timonensis TaxID=1907662 RepID=A0ABM7WIN2_9ACTN|nr:hypothetical protein CE91St30_14840 [Raoultibacter timonensis]BDF50755.1 hypothetical protein CE91St31_14850 [Raoultibacter timonensis]